MARQAQLVSQHLENISHEALSKYQDVIRSYVRGRQGIYALYRKNELYYVGLASNLRSQSTKLRASFRNALIKARVRRNGLIRYKNKDYNSPSHAASAVVKRSCNGWTFWKYERAPGDWVFLNELRR